MNFAVLKIRFVTKKFFYIMNNLRLDNQLSVPIVFCPLQSWWYQWRSDRSRNLQWQFTFLFIRTIPVQKRGAIPWATKKKCGDSHAFMMLGWTSIFLFWGIQRAGHYRENNLLNESINCPRRTMQKLIFLLDPSRDILSCIASARHYFHAVL